MADSADPSLAADRSVSDYVGHLEHHLAQVLA